MPFLHVSGRGCRTSKNPEEELAALDSPDIESPDDSPLYSYAVRVALAKEFLDSQGAEYGVGKRKPLPKSPVDLRKSRRKSDLVQQDTLTEFVRRLFRLDYGTHQSLLFRLIPLCNEETLFRDITNFLNQLENDEYPFRRPEDFYSIACYRAWKQEERSALLKMMMEISKFYPRLSRTLGERITHPGINSMNSKFSLIPNQKDEFYRRILEKCIEMDCFEEKVFKPTGLSAKSTILLAECGNRWRLSSTFRATAYFEALIYLFQRDREMLSMVWDVLKKVDFIVRQSTATIARTDASFHCSTLLKLKDIVYAHVLVTQSLVDPLHFGNFLHKSIKILYLLSDNPLLQRECPQHALDSESITQLVRDAVTRRYEIAQTPSGDTRDMQILVRLERRSDQVLKDIDSLRKCLPGELRGGVRLRDVMVQKEMELFFEEIDSWWAYPQAPPQTQVITELFDVYFKTWSLYEMSQEYPTDQRVSITNLKWDEWFSSGIDAWVGLSHRKTCNWIKNAIEFDKFQPDDGGYHSTSILDLLTVLHREVDVLAALRWPSFNHKYRNVRIFAKLICSTFDHFAQVITSKVAAELKLLQQADAMSKNKISPTDQGQSRPPDARIHHRLKTAKQLFQSGKVRRRKKQQCLFGVSEKYERACVMINNVSRARANIDSVYAQLVGTIKHGLDTYVPFSQHEETIVKIEVLDARFDGSLKGESESTSRGTLQSQISVNGIVLGRVPVPSRRHANEGSSLVYEHLSGQHLHMPFALSADVEVVLWRLDPLRDCEDIVARGRTSLSRTLFPQGSDGVPFAEQEVHLGKDNGSLFLRFTKMENDYVFYWFRETYANYLVREKHLVAMLTEKVLPHVLSTMSVILERGKGQVQKHLRLPLTAKMTSLSAVKQGRKSVASEEHGAGEHWGADLSQSDKEEIDDLLDPFLDLLNRHLFVWNSSLEPEIAGNVLRRLWNSIVEHFCSIAVKRVSQKTGKRKRLRPRQRNMCVHALETVYNFLHAEGEGMPHNLLETHLYLKVSAVLHLYHLGSEELMRAYLSCLMHSANERLEKMRRFESRATIRRGSVSFTLHADETEKNSRPCLSSQAGVSSSRRPLPRTPDTDLEGIPPHVTRKMCRPPPPSTVSRSITISRRASTDSRGTVVAGHSARSTGGQTPTVPNVHAVYTLLELRADVEEDVRGFLEEQREAENQILANLAREGSAP